MVCFSLRASSLASKFQYVAIVWEKDIITTGTIAGQGNGNGAGTNTDARDLKHGAESGLTDNV